MFCKQCGKAIGEGTQFCPACGTRVDAGAASEGGNHRNSDQKGGAKSKKWIAIPIAVFAVAAIGVTAGYLMLRNGSKKLQEQYNAVADQITQANIPVCQEELEELEDSWQELGLFDSEEKEVLLEELDQVVVRSQEYVKQIEACDSRAVSARAELSKYNLSENEYALYEAAISNLEATIKERDVDSLDAGINGMEQALEELVKANDAYVNGKIEEYGNVNFSIAEASDISTYNSRLEEVKTLLEKKEYGTMPDIFTELDDIYYKYIEPQNYLNMAVQQVDVTAYPNIRLYLSVTDRNTGEVAQGLDGGMFFIRKKDANGDYIKQVVKSVNQLDETEALNIDIVADVSGSMDGNALNTAKSVMTNFVNSVQFGAGDMVELISFSNGVYIEEPFTNDANTLITKINGLYTQNMTAFYDALYTAVNKVAACSGAKCVIAFTDGLDNYSSCTSSDVIQLAQRYHIPIFIIGIGYDDFSEAREIALQTGGNYYYVYDIYNIQDIYQEIYRQEKQLYLVEFEDSSSVNLFSESSIVAGYHTAEYGGDVNYTYTPHTLVSVDSAGLFLDGPEAVVAAYMRAFADAMTYQDYSYITSYLKEGSSIAAAQEKYVQRGIAEVLDSYEIENVEYSDSDHCIVTTRETYFVQKTGEPLALLAQRCKYVVEKEGNDWKITDFAEKVNVLSNIKY